MSISYCVLLCGGSITLTPTCPWNLQQHRLDSLMLHGLGLALGISDKSLSAL